MYCIITLYMQSLPQDEISIKVCVNMRCMIPYNRYHTKGLGILTLNSPLRIFQYLTFV